MQERCLEQLIEGFKMLVCDDVGLILLGGSNKSQYYKHIVKLSSDDKRIVTLSYIQSPKHLLLTKGCAYGVTLYAPISFNNIYCAPNKIFEYAESGLGNLLPEYPEISEINEKYSIGYTCVPLDPNSIKNALNNLMKNDIVYYKKKSRIFLTNFQTPINSYKKFLHNLI